MSLETHPACGNSENVMQKCTFSQPVSPNNGIVGRTFETCSLFFESMIVFSGYMCFAHKNLCFNHIAGGVELWILLPTESNVSGDV